MHSSCQIKLECLLESIKSFASKQLE
jgi:hypothetical protein